jgi:glycosyltransferase involved in cell wall biosynthesis
VYASDDGSSDNTLSILKTYAEQWGPNKLVIRRGAQQGLCANFMSMVLDPQIHADCYALCDQDDVWLPEKLSRALNELNQAGTSATPSLYCSRTQYVSESLAPLGLSKAYQRTPSFRNALVQSLAGGNTMLFNHSVKQLAMQAGVKQAVVHDWWLYLLVTGAGGTVVFDAEAPIMYRQHEASTIGSANGFVDQLKRLRNLVLGQHKAYAHTHIQALNQARPCLTPEHQQVLTNFEALHRAKGLLQRFKIYKRLGLYRQTAAGALSLSLAVLLGKI